MLAQQMPNGNVRVELTDMEPLAYVTGPTVLEVIPQDGLPLWDALRELGVKIEPAPEPVPASVPDFKFAGEAEARGFITTAQCDAWVGSGVIPPTLLSKVEQIVPDAGERRRVVLFLMGAKEFPRYNDNTVALAALFGLTTSAEIDDFFVAAGHR